MPLFCFITVLLFAKTDTVQGQILTPQQTAEFFTPDLNKQLGITYPIRRVYNCTDKSGQFFIVLTESNDLTATRKDTLHHNIRMFRFDQNKNKLLKSGEMYDHIGKNLDGSGMENSIWFWTKYCGFTDVDHDGWIDPIIVYGTSGPNHTDDGRIRILIYYKNQKYAIRHQNGTLDFERNTRIDKSFYSLPLSLQKHVKQLMQTMTDNGHAIFPYNWQTAMKNRKLYFDENH